MTSGWASAAGVTSSCGSSPTATVPPRPLEEEVRVERPDPLERDDPPERERDVEREP